MTEQSPPEAPQRRRLPNRRPSLIIPFEWNGQHLTASVGFDPLDLQPREIFLSGAKEGTDLVELLEDAAVVISIALQRGATIQDLYHTIHRPGSIIGAALAALTEVRCFMFRHH